MRIIIVGAGAIGGYIAERLSLEGQDVVVIEINPKRAAEIRDRLDALVITGNGASASILAEAGADEADLLLAVSTSDGANIIACHTAMKMGVPRTVARVQDPGLKDGLEGLAVAFVIDPVESAANEIAALVSESGVSELTKFGGGSLSHVGGTAPAHSPPPRLPREDPHRDTRTQDKAGPDHRNDPGGALDSRPTRRDTPSHSGRRS